MSQCQQNFATLPESQPKWYKLRIMKRTLTLNLLQWIGLSHPIPTLTLQYPARPFAQICCWCHLKRSSWRKNSSAQQPRCKCNVLLYGILEPLPTKLIKIIYIYILTNIEVRSFECKDQRKLQAVDWITTPYSSILRESIDYPKSLGNHWPSHICFRRHMDMVHLIHRRNPTFQKQYGP